MSLTLRQIKATDQRLDLRDILPHRLLDMQDAEIRRKPLHLGNRKVPLSELFEIEREEHTDSTLILVPLNNRIDFVGNELREGRIIVRGDVGDYTGRAMRGGDLQIEGSVGDYAGSGLRNGRLTVDGNAGDSVGAPAAGERQGQQGGFIHIRGEAGSRAGERQRRGILLIEGNAGDLLGHRMIAGTAYIGGRVGELAGYGMRRGSLLLRHTPALLCDTIRYNGRHHLPFMHLLLNELQRLSNGTIGPVGDDPEVERHLGDLACDGRGEILVID